MLPSAPPSLEPHPRDDAATLFGKGRSFLEARGYKEGTRRSA
ncbi:MAG: hypothetical protein ACYC6F_14390 [Longimicrobiales bacterium]